MLTIRWRQISGGLLFLGAIVLLTLGGQWQLNAFHAPIENDPAGHYVSAALIHDWVTTWPLRPPLAFLVDFHAHYPVVGLGFWPPAYHTLLAAWMMAKPSSYEWAILFSTLTTVLFAVLAGFAARAHGWGWAAAVSFAVVVSPIVRSETSQVMLDVLTSALCFGGALAYARFLRTGRWQASLLFALVAVLALYTKGNALALGLLPPLALLYARQVGLVTRPAFWVAVPFVVMLVGPWYFLTAGRTQEGARFVAGLDYTLQAIPFYARAMLDLGGPVVLLLALAALVRGMWRGLDPLQAASAALVLSAFTFHVIVPVALQQRYVLMALPALLILATGVLAPLLPGWRGPAVIAASVAVWTALFGPQPSPDSGFAAAAQAARAVLDRDNPVILVATDAQTEPGLIAQLAALDTRRPSVWALRGSRLLGGGGFNNHEYVPLYSDLAGVRGALSQHGVRYLLLRHTGATGEWPHLAQLASLARGSDGWRMVTAIPHPGGDILLLEVPGQAGRIADAEALTRLAGPRWGFGAAPAVR